MAPPEAYHSQFPAVVSTAGAPISPPTEAGAGCFHGVFPSELIKAKYQSIINSLLNQHGSKYAKLMLLFQNQF